MDIAVLGATGTLGRLLTAHLEAVGHIVRPASRREGVDALTGVGLNDLLRGADVVVDALNVETLSGRKARSAFDRIATNVARSALRQDVGRIVCVSIAGATDPAVHRFMGYYQGKAVQERAYAAASVPSTIIHSTQWFDLVDQMMWRASIGPVAVLPTMRMALVAADSVAALVAQEASGHPAPEGVDEGENRTVAIRGPEIFTSAQAARRIRDRYGSAGGSTAPFITELPYMGLGPAGGGLIPTEGIVDPVTLDQWIDARR